MKKKLYIQLNSCLVILFSLLLWNGNAQSISREIIVLDENVSTEDSIIQINLVYMNNQIVSFKGNIFEVDTTMTDSLVHIQILYGIDTVNVCSNDAKMFEQFLDQMTEMQTNYLKKYKRSFINSPVKWEMVVDHPPFETYYREDHQELFEEKINQCKSGIIFHVRNTNSHLNFKCRD